MVPESRTIAVRLLPCSHPLIDLLPLCQPGWRLVRMLLFGDSGTAPNHLVQRLRPVFLRRLFHEAVVPSAQSIGEA